MTISTKALGLSIAVLALGLTTLPAAAAAAYASQHLNVRSGPGTGFEVIDNLSRGEVVDVQGCKGSWCFVKKSGPDGWVSAKYLTSDRYYEDDYYDEDYYLPPPRRKSGPSISFGFQFGTPKPVPSYPHPAPYPQVTPYPTLDPYGNPIGNDPGGQVCFNGPNGYYCSGG